MFMVLDLFFGLPGWLPFEGPEQCRRVAGHFSEKSFPCGLSRDADAARNESVTGKEVRALLGGYGFARIPRCVERNRREYNFSVRRRRGCSPQKRNGVRPKVGSVGLEFDRFDWPGRIQGIAVGDVNPNDADIVGCIDRDHGGVFAALVFEHRIVFSVW